MSTLDDNVTDMASELDTSLGRAYSIGGDQQLNYREVGISSVSKNCTHDHPTHRMVTHARDMLLPKGTVVSAVP